jgi:CubicO group peptidase (beta-lactamase class C family)
MWTMGGRPGEVRALAAAVALAAAGGTTVARPAPTGNPSVARADVDAVFATVDKPDTPGCALAVIQDGEVVYERGYGMADLDHDVRIGPATPFHVASVSKQFTAAAIVLLAEEGKLSLDDDVRRYIPELPAFGGATITLRHLVHHTSGLRDQWDLLGLAGWRYSLDLITDGDVLEVVARQKELNFRPGEAYLYCNTGYTLLGLVVKRVSGRSLREFTKTRIFEPLGMESTHFRDDHAEVIKGQAYGYEPAGDGFRLSVTNFDTVGATSLFTTVEDLARWVRNFDRPQIGGAWFVPQLLETGKLKDGRKLDYAFGLKIGTYKGLPIVEHAGSDAGYRAHLIRFPDQRFAVACLCNAAGLLRPRVAVRRVADLYLPGLPPGDDNVPAVAPVPEERLAEKAGIYWDRDSDGIQKLAFEKGSLVAVSGDDRLLLRPIATGRFRLADLPLEIAFEPEEGTPRRLRMTGDGFPVVFEALPAVAAASDGSEFAGRWLADEIDPVYRVLVRDGKLVLLRSKNPPETLEPVAKDLFRASVGTVRFGRDAQGRVTEMLLSTGRVRRLRFHREVTAAAGSASRR